MGTAFTLGTPFIENENWTPKFKILVTSSERRLPSDERRLSSNKRRLPSTRFLTSLLTLTRAFLRSTRF
ncbi:hypothetical protein VNO80_26982 [Phaseolus coccineus]|uniref:Uncharacterized protein n=1 Tax=Phaseolus coccineus TaxID=3886 RepID=A0AAN9LG08_PHACN